MDQSVGAAIVIVLGVAALVGSVILAVLVARLDRREAAHGKAVTHPRQRAASTASRRDRAPRAA